MKLAAKVLSAYREDILGKGVSLEQVHPVYAEGSIGSLVRTFLTKTPLTEGGASLWDAAKMELQPLIKMAMSLGIDPMVGEIPDPKDQYGFRKALQELTAQRFSTSLDQTTPFSISL